MAFPKILKDFNLFGDGDNWITQIEEVQLPKLERKVEEYIAGGMAAPVDIDMGLEKLEMEWTAASLMPEIFDGFGAISLTETLLRFTGACEDDTTGDVVAVEIVARGRHREIDSGSAKRGEKNQVKVITSLGYYKLTIDGKEKIEIDPVGYIFKVNGKDMLANRRKALGI